MGSDLSAKTVDALRNASALLQAGQHADAAAALRGALDAAPGDAGVANVLGQLLAAARMWLTVGQAQQALAILAPLAASEHAGGATLRLHGHALMTLGRKDEAEAAFRRWLQHEPQNGEAALRLAAVLADSNRSQESEALVRAEIASRGEHPEALFVLGRALLGLARFDEAETAFRKVVHAHPEHQSAQSNLMELVWMRSGDVQAASRALDKALRGQPQLAGLRITKARLLMSARMPREALAIIDAGLELSPDAPALLKAASTIALECDGARALGYARRLRQVATGDRATLVELGNASLATGDAPTALQAAEVLHGADPTDGRAMAMQADALRMLGDERYRQLMDYRSFVRADLIDVPEGWPDRTSYLSELAADLVRVHTLRAHPIGNSLRGGSQIQLEPAKSPFASIRAFPQAIDGPIRRYLEALGTGSDPMRRRNTGRYRISGIWTVRLRPNGYHVSHYHPEGWISSACYIVLPPAVGQGGEGWLKFGEPAFPTTPALSPEYFIRPEPGLLALFPSYLWHGTVPFSGDPADSRVTIAFDVVPDLS